jgi:hypothetical protein
MIGAHMRYFCAFATTELQLPFILTIIYFLIPGLKICGHDDVEQTHLALPLLSILHFCGLRH